MDYDPIATSQHRNITTSQLRYIRTSQHRNIATSQHRNIATSQHRNIATSQHRNIATSQHRNIAIAIATSIAIGFSPSLFAFSFSNLFSKNKTIQLAQASTDQTAVQKTQDTQNSVTTVTHHHSLKHKKKKCTRHKKHKKHPKKHYHHPYPTKVAPIPETALIPILQLHKWSVFGGLGWSDYLSGTSNKTFAVNNLETDQLTEDSGGSSVGYTVGFARNYDVSAKARCQKLKLQLISIGATLRYDPSTLNGQVYQYQDPTFNNYTYKYQIRPISELFETDLFFKKINKIHASPFIIAGVGMTQASLTYQETAQAGIPASSAKNLSAWKVTEDLAIGAGLQFNLKKNYFMRAQYLYQYRGNARLNSATLLQGVPINLNEQSVDVIAGYQFK